VVKAVWIELAQLGSISLAMVPSILQRPSPNGSMGLRALDCAGRGQDTGILVRQLGPD